MPQLDLYWFLMKFFLSWMLMSLTWMMMMKQKWTTKTKLVLTNLISKKKMKKWKW